MFRGEPQVYGTQYQVRDGQLTLWTARDADGLDERRTALGLEPEQVNRARIMAAEGLAAEGLAAEGTGDDPPAPAGNPDQL